MIDPQEGREPCPELEAVHDFVVGWHGMRPWVVICRKGEITVPCLVTPLLTADEREKLIGEGP